MIRIAICEDDSFFLKKEKAFIENYIKEKSDDYEIATFVSGKDLMSHYKDIYDVIFLDVAMEEIDGIAIAKWIRQQKSKVYIVFITAYAEYSIEGYKVEAHRFLLKNSENMQENLKECLDSIWDKLQKTESKVTLPVQGGDLVIDASKIVFAESKVHKVTIHVKEQSGKLQEYYMYDRLDNVQEVLRTYGFSRIHQSYLINTGYLVSVSRYKAELSVGIELGISKKYYKEIEEQYIRMRGEF